MPGSSASDRPASSGVRTALQVGRKLFVFVLAGIVGYLGLCLTALLIYSWHMPPVTGVQLQRTLEAQFASSSSVRAYEPISLSQMAPSLPLAAVAAEDSRFFRHNGIDWEAVGEAIEEYQDGDRLRGGSTITQQLVKNLFMTTHSTYVRKGLEVPLTYAAELVLSKRRILELYLNVIEWGPRVYGAEAAAQFHYGTSARHLTRRQAAGLAACIPNPLARRPQTAGWYRDIILERMAILGRLPLPSAPRPAPKAPQTTGAPNPSTDSLPDPASADSTPSLPDSTPPPPDSVPVDTVSPADSVHVDSPAVPPDSTARTSVSSF